MVAACKLHDAGVMHNQLAPSIAHVKMSPEGPFIFDFSKAKVHKCGGAYPKLVVPQRGNVAKSDCEELVELELYIGHKTGDLKDVYRILSSY